MNPSANSARGMDGKVIRRGDMVSLVDPYDGKTVHPPVLVLDIYRQGYDGTILHTEPAPSPEFPHHKQCVAKNAMKVTLTPKGA